MAGMLINEHLSLSNALPKQKANALPEQGQLIDSQGLEQVASLGPTEGITGHAAVGILLDPGGLLSSSPAGTQLQLFLFET